MAVGESSGAPGAGFEGGDSCGQLCLVTEASGWNPECEELFFAQELAEGADSTIRHQLCIGIAARADGPAAARGPAAGEPRRALLAFQIVSVHRQWDWLLHPRSKPRGGTAWGQENVLIPDLPDAVEVAIGDNRTGRGRYFCIVEEPGINVTVHVELIHEPGSAAPRAHVWYERMGHKPTFYLAPSGTGQPSHDALSEQSSGVKSKVTEPKSLERPEHAGLASDGPAECSQELYVVCEASDWSLKEEKLVFQPMWSETVERWSWTELGVAAVKATKEYFGYPRPGDPFTEAHMFIIEQDNPDTTYESLGDHGFIKYDSHTLMRHHVGVRLAQAAALNKFNGEPVAWEFAFASLTFQVISRQKGWGWRLFPAKRADAGPDAWGQENILVPGMPEAVPVTHGSQVHGRNFHIVEPHGTFVTVIVDLLHRGGRDAPQLEARVWYERRSKMASNFIGCDVRPPVKKEVFLALELQGKDAAREYDDVVRARCPRWWRAWDREEEARRQAAAGGRPAWEARRTLAEEVERAWAVRSAALTATEEVGGAKRAVAGIASRGAEANLDASRPFTRNEAIEHLGWCIAFLADKKHEKVLGECRQNSTVKCGLFETFPFLPPKAMSILSNMVQLVLDRAKCGSLHDFLDRFSAVAWDGKVSKTSERLATFIETGANEPIPDQPSKGERERARSGKDRLSVGMSVAVKWVVDSQGARYLSKLDGHFGTLTSFDKATRRWTVSLKGTDSGSLEVGAEHLVASSSSAPPTPAEAAAAEAAGNVRCNMCLNGFRESELIKLACGHAHRYCHVCLRQWFLRQTVPRCYACLMDRDMLRMPKGASDRRPWLALVQSEDQATLEHRLSHSEVNRLPCLCYSEVRAGAPCIIMGHVRAGERCLVGHITRADVGGAWAGSASVYLKDGSLAVVKATSCLAPDDCLAAGRAQRGEPCPAKSLRFRYSSGLVCASLGCACMVREALDWLGLARSSMPFDWLISRVEGVLYFLRHAFRDFCHHDGKGEVIHVDARTMTAFQSAYHSFLHHDLDEPGIVETFRRRGERMMSLVTAPGRYGTARPVLLIRLCAKSAELDSADELYAAVRLLGGPKVYLLVIVSEQSESIGAVVHAFQPNLIFYVAGSTAAAHKSPDILGAIRFGIDYVSLRTSYGDARSCFETHQKSKISPVPSGAALRFQLSSQHQLWLKRDSRGRPSTSNADGCFDAGPSQFFPGKFQMRGAVEASPHSSPDLVAAVEKGDPDMVMARASCGADVNAWDARGETPLFRAARRADPVVCAALMLSAADPNCRARNGSRAKDHVALGKPHAAHVRTLLLLGGGLEPVPDSEALAAVASLPEPFRRQLCGRLGLTWAPEAQRRRLAPASGTLFLRQLMADAQARSNDHAEALSKLRGAVRGDPVRCRKAVRSLLRQWHPDKHFGSSREQREHASDVFSYIHDLCAFALEQHGQPCPRAPGSEDR